VESEAIRHIMEHTLEVFSGEALVFSSTGKWLYPLFELEDFLAATDYESAHLTVKDKIVGRASALLLVHFGVGYIIAGIMSHPGKEALEKHNIKYGYDSLVDRITCRTEEILADEYDPQRAYVILKERAGLRHQLKGSGT
jgi:zinc transport system ATP-binding protein